MPPTAPAPAPPPVPASTGPTVRIPLAWALVVGLGGFCLCLLVVVAFLAGWMLRNPGRQDVANSGASGATAANAPKANGAGGGAGQPFLTPDGQPLPNGGIGNAAAPGDGAAGAPDAIPGAAAGNAADNTAAVLNAVAEEVAKQAEDAGAPPQVQVGPVSVLGRQGELDSLAPPEKLPKGMLAFLTGLERLHALQPDKAIARFDEALQADDENARYHTGRGAALVLSEKMEQALPDLARAMKLDPRNPLPSRLTRLAYLMLGDQLKASKFQGHGGHADIDFLITEVGVYYGIRATSGKSNVPLAAQDLKKAAAASQKLPTLMRLVATSFQTGDEMSSQALYALGVSQIEAGEFVSARRCFEAVVAKHPTDWSARQHLGRCMLEAGDPESARNELTYVLTWSRFLPEAFAARARCAARQNDLKRAERDLATAKKLDPAKAAEAEAAVAAARENPAPEGAAADGAAWERLLDDAKKNVKFEELATSALALRRGVDARRRRWDETYQDRLFDLVSAARSQAGNADRLADVAEYLRENNQVLALQVAPQGSTQFLRRQTGVTKQQEIELAYALAEEALHGHPKHARSWAVKSAILLHTYGRLTEAEKSAEYAVQFDPKLISGHMALSDCYKEYATRLRERAAALRAPKPATRSVRIVDQNGNFVRTDSETYYIPASPAELALAAECDRQAAIYASREQASLDAALAAAKGTPQEPFYQALLLFLKKDYQGARGWLEKAVAQNPEDAVMRRRLATCLEKLELTDESTEEFARAVNLQQTTAAVWLAVAWKKLERSSWTDAGRALARARELDPADARVAAYQSIHEEQGKNDPAAALATVVLALAQEEARARANKSTFLTNAEPGQRLAAEDIGLTIVLRLKLAKGMWTKNAAVAAECYLTTAANEARMNEWQLAKPVESAMLPFPDRDPKLVAAPPPLVALLKNNRVYAGQTLLNANRGNDAAVHFAAAENFANLLPAGGTAYLEFELEPQYVPFRVSSMPIYAKLLNGAALIQQKRLNEAKLELQQVRYYLANRSLEQQQMTDDPIPAMYQRLAPAVGLK